MKKRVSLLIVVLLMTSAATARIEHYVSTTGNDANDGTARNDGHAWKTIAHAASLAVAGWTVHVAVGTYSESTITVSASGTAAAPIVFISDTQLGAVIADSSWHAFYVTGDYVTINGFEVYMTNPGSASAIIETHGSYLNILNNYVHDVDTIGTSCWGGAAIDVYSDTRYVKVIGNRVAHAGLPNQSPTLCTHGNMNAIYIGGDHNYVANNIVWDTTGNCIQLWPYFSNGVVINNDVDHCGSPYDPPGRDAGITVGNDGISGTTINNLIANNIVRDVLGYALRDCCSGSAPQLPEQYLNNDAYGATVGNYFFYQGGSTNSGDLSIDPQYVNYIAGSGPGGATGGGDYHLQSTSPVIDKGTSKDAPRKDIAGTPRPQGAGFDMGSYEFYHDARLALLPVQTE